MLKLAMLLMCVQHAVASDIDRKALVQRFSPGWSRIEPDSAFMVGNGNFAFTADITGLQTFQDQYSPLVPLITQSQWAWHSFPNPANYRLEDAMTAINVRGSSQLFPYFADWSKAQDPAIKWLRENPHRISLGRVGLHLVHPDGTAAVFADLASTVQRLDMWNGVLISDFVFEHTAVHVETRVHPHQDMLIISIRSALLNNKAIGVELKFPGVAKQLNPDPADWLHPESHVTTLISQTRRAFSLSRKLDDTQYAVHVAADQKIDMKQAGAHRFIVTGDGQPSLTMMVNFTRPSAAQHVDKSGFAPERLLRDVQRYWHDYWNKGGFVDFSGSSDPRATELQRRVLLSQYLMAVNASGELPPQEDGLFSNSWNGKFHLEMPLWHLAHFATWGHADLLERVMPWYMARLPDAKQRAKAHGLKGAWWPKMVGPEGRESPSAVNPFIMWQQPHPVYLAELIYRSKPDVQTLKRYKDVVFETAELLASYVYLDTTGDRYLLGPPVIPVQEVFAPERTVNPAFELAYFRFGLLTAQKWRERLHLPRNEEWDRVLHKLSRLPQREGLYLPAESEPEFWRQAMSSLCSGNASAPSCLNRDHPSMLMTMGLLPGDDVDRATMERTLDAVDHHWDMRQLWGWDYPAMAMTAARLHEPSRAVDYLFASQRNNQYGLTGMTPREHLANGSYVRDSATYFPSNGSLLLAIGMMTAGWDGEQQSHPGFPADGWKVRSEGIAPLP